jgi:hypothetical protein
VSTYIYRTEVSKVDGDRRVVFPTFASHWAVIFFELNSQQKNGHAYHLTSHDPVAAQLSPAGNTSREVRFTSVTLDEMPESMKEESGFDQRINV